jgi:predicted phage tail protein
VDDERASILAGPDITNLQTDAGNHVRLVVAIVAAAAIVVSVVAVAAATAVVVACAHGSGLVRLYGLGAAMQGVEQNRQHRCRI